MAHRACAQWRITPGGRDVSPRNRGHTPEEVFLATLSDPAEAARWEADLAFADLFIARFGWCGGVLERRVGCAAAAVSALLYRVVQAEAQPEEADGWHWIVAGDAPPLVLDAASAPAPGCVLLVYCRELERRAAAVRAGAPLDDLTPLLRADGLGLLEPTPEAADLIEERVAGIRAARRDPRALLGRRRSLTASGVCEDGHSAVPAAEWPHRSAAAAAARPAQTTARVTT